MDAYGWWHMVWRRIRFILYVVRVLFFISKSNQTYYQSIFTYKTSRTLRLHLNWIVTCKCPSWEVVKCEARDYRYVFDRSVQVTISGIKIDVTLWQKSRMCDIFGCKHSYQDPGPYYLAGDSKQLSYCIRKSALWSAFRCGLNQISKLSDDGINSIIKAWDPGTEYSYV